jgi:hypothetical protein
MGKALLATILAAVFAVGLAIPAVARSDTRVEIWCETEEGDQMLWKVVDVNAIQLSKDPGGIDGAVDNFNHNNPYGEHCQIGPFT